MSYFEIKDNCLYCCKHGEIMKIAPWGKDSLRVTARVAGEIEEYGYALSSCEKTEPEIILENDRARLKNGKITAEVYGNDNRLKFTNQKGEVLLEEYYGDFPARRFSHLSGSSFALELTFRANENEHIYGMGQYQNGLLDLKGASLDLMQRNRTVSVPFMISSLGYGFLWHNPAIGRVSFSADRTIWSAESSSQLDYYITAGETPEEISFNYANAVGFAPMPPEYGLGFWQCKLRYYNQEQLLSVAREYKRRNIPIDVIVCDFFHWPYCGDFRFDEEYFPDPKAMVDELRSMGIELMVSVWTNAAYHSENFSEYSDKNYLVSLNNGFQNTHRMMDDSLVLDFTNEKVRKNVWAKLKRNYYDYGIKIFWLDNAEPDFELAQFKNYNYHIGSAQETNNIYPKCFSQMVYEGIEEEAGDKNQMHLVRSAWAGSQKYGALVWSGDIMSTWEDFRNQIPAGLNIGAAGIPWWNTDIGGFWGADINDEGFRELLIRWFQFGTYCPVMRLHGCRQPITNPKRKDGTEAMWTGADNEVWSYGEEAEKIMVKYINRRESLRDYIRDTMKQSAETGKPVMRAMWYAFPGDKNCIDLKDEYMFGDSYLVAPVTEAGAVERTVYFPVGTQWTDVDTGLKYTGGQRVNIAAPIERIPVFEIVK